MWLMYEGRGWNGPPSAEDLEQIRRQRARSGGGGPPFGGAHWNPGPAFGAVARAHPSAVQGANKPKLGVGLSPSFEPSSASLEWVRERVGGGSVRAWKLGTPRHLGSALSRPRSRCGPAGRSLGIGAARGRGVFNQTGENRGPGQPHGARGLDRWCPDLSAPPACAPRARRTYDGADARQAHARHPSPIAEDPPPNRGGGRRRRRESPAWGWEFSYEDMATEVEALGFRVSPSTIRRNLDNDEWRAMQMRVLPMLNEEHREKRLAYANEHQGDDWYCEVDLDEKWVYSVHTHALLKLPPDEPVPV